MPCNVPHFVTFEHALQVVKFAGISCWRTKMNPQLREEEEKGGQIGDFDTVCKIDAWARFH